MEKPKGLAPGERASLVGELLATLDEPDASIDMAWRDEVERRIDIADRTAESPVDWAEARGRLGL